MTFSFLSNIYFVIFQVSVIKYLAFNSKLHNSLFIDTDWPWWMYRCDIWLAVSAPAVFHLQLHSGIDLMLRVPEDKLWAEDDNYARCCSGL